MCLATAVMVSLRTWSEDWPQFRGPGRNGVSAETGLLQEWPDSGPPLRWRATDLGVGYSSPIIAGERVFITGDRGERLIITALDRKSGGIRWETANGTFWKGPYPGARASCTVAAGRLFHMNAHGRLICLDPASGTEHWHVDVLPRFDAPNIHWGISECVLVDRDRVIVTAGGKQAFLAALDVKTGDTVWAGPPLRFTRTKAFGGRDVDPPQEDTDAAGYGSPIRFDVDGRRLIAAVGSRHYVIADADTGALLWTQEVPVRHEVIGAIPVWCDAGLLFAAPDVGATLYSVSNGKDGNLAVRERWKHPIDNCHGALLEHGGRIYGSGYRQYRPWACIDANTGRQLYELEGLAKGSSLFADGRLYAFSERGNLALLEPMKTSFDERGRIRVAEKPGRDVWSHPAISEGHLFVRWEGILSCFDIRAK